MKGAKEKIVYIGKAKSLKNRLASYFQRSSSLDQRKLKMVNEIKEFDYIVTENELEALVLEANYIKRNKPKYNIILRDDKNFPYLKLAMNEDWPWLEVVRKIEKNGARYFGPYVPAGAMWEMLKFIRRNFPVRMCRYNLQKPFRPCVQYQMKRCLAPCSKDLRGEADREKYMEIVKDVGAFIQGEKKELLLSLQGRMKKLSDEQRYEDAAEIRDRLEALQKAWESQRVISPELGDVDVIGFSREDSMASIFVLFIRNGMVIGQKDFFLNRLDGMCDKEIIESFIEQFYSKELLLPSKIIVPLKADFSTQKQWLSRKRGSRLSIHAGKRGPEAEVLKMSNENARYSLKRHIETGVDETLTKLKDLLRLQTIPEKIAAVDVSNISGSEAVGAVVVYEDRKFLKDEYRLFNIKGVEGINDFAMIEETVRRYLKNLAEKERLPQLIIIDGGRGQLESALKALKASALDVNVMALAKAKDEQTEKRSSGIRTDVDRVYLPGAKVPVYLEPYQDTTHLLQKIRDEVHRFAITCHKKLRTKRVLQSPLEKIKGIGKTRRLLLLKHFGSLNAIRNASAEEIASIKGMNRKVAEELKQSL